MSIKALINRFYETLEDESYEDPSIMANDYYDRVLGNKSLLELGQVEAIKDILYKLDTSKIPRTIEIFKLIQGYYNKPKS